MATLKQRLHRKNGSSYDTIHLETNATVVKMSSTDSTTVSSKISSMNTSISSMNSSISSMNSEMSSLKTSVSNGKSLIASAITDKGVSTASSATFQTMANNISKISSGISGVPVAGKDFTYSGDYQVLNDGNNNWRIKFLTSGTFIPKSDMEIDAFYVGGGGGYYLGAGGGGGYTKTTKSIILYANTSYPLVIGAGGASTYEISNIPSMESQDGGNTSGFNSYAAGGKAAYKQPSNSIYNGGDGGSGGSGTLQKTCGDGGSDGGDGKKYGGKGQGTTTREFGSSVATLYSGGGGSYNKDATTQGKGGAGGGGDAQSSGTPNTGGGAGGIRFGNNITNTIGGSGILIIRNAQ